jgi:hypothetical protein
LEDVAEGGIRWRGPQLQSKSLSEHGVVANGEPLKVALAMATAQDSQHRHQQQIAAWDAADQSVTPCLTWKGVKAMMDY